MATEFISVVATSGGDYTSLAAWQTGCVCDLTAAATKVFAGTKTGTVSDGDSVTGATSSATGTVAHCTATQILIKSISGTFQSGEQIEVDASNYFTTSDAGDSAIAVAAVSGTVTSGSAFVFSGWTADTTNFPWVKAKSGEEHTGIPNTGATVRWGTWNATALSMRQNYGRITDLEFESSTNNVTRYIYYDSAGTGLNSIISRCVFHKGSNNYITAVEGFSQASDNIHVNNCIALDSLGNAFRSAWSKTGCVINNCTAVDCSNGFATNASSMLIKNCVAYNSGTTDFPGTFYTGSDYNASGDTSANGAGSNYITGIGSSEFNNYSSDDFHLAAASQLIGAGVNLYSDPNLRYDIDNEDMGSDTDWSIGADYVEASDSVAPTYGTAPALHARGDTTANFDATASDETATQVDHYMGVYAAGSTPSTAEVKAGNGTGFVAGTSKSVLTVNNGVEASFAQVTGLTAATSYRACFTVEEAGGGNLATVNNVDFSTTETFTGTATEGDAAVSMGIPSLVNPITIRIDVADRNLTLRPNLTSLSWSWFDEDDAGTLTSPTDQGTAETTDANSELAIVLNTTTLTSGQYGRLVLESNDKSETGMYRIVIP